MSSIILTEQEIVSALVFCIVLSFFFNPLENFGSKVKDALTKVEVFKPTKQLQIKDEIIVQMLDENGNYKYKTMMTLDENYLTNSKH